MRFGLIGRTLTHSFSKTYFEGKFRSQGRADSFYDNIELQTIQDLSKLRIREIYRGLNVTIPYKETIIPYLDEVDETANTIGAVNCVDIRGGKLKGYNTDAYGFSQSIKPFLDRNHERALILGTGGASKAVAYVLKKLGIPFYFVSRSNPSTLPHVLTYDQLNSQIMLAFKLIVNTTPIGMYPLVDECPPILYDHLTPEHLLYDLIYNPEETLFLKKGKEKGTITVNGLSMLQLQAEKSWEIWNR